MSVLQKQATEMYIEARGYLKSLERVLDGTSKFNEDLQYNIVTMCIEKLYMTYLSQKKQVAIHHTPMALLNDAQQIEEFPDVVVETTKMIAQCESICTLDGFGHITPTKEELFKMVEGLYVLDNFIIDRLGQQFIEQFEKQKQTI